MIDPITLRLTITATILSFSTVHIIVLSFVVGLVVGYTIGRGIRNLPWVKELLRGKKK